MRRKISFFSKIFIESLTVPGGILKFAVKIGASASRLVSSFSPGGTNKELHNPDVAKSVNNNFYKNKQTLAIKQYPNN
jgi:hypothetical protein